MFLGRNFGHITREKTIGTLTFPAVPAGLPSGILANRFHIRQAEQQLFPSELNYAQYRAQLFSSLVNIHKAMGGGWVAVAGDAASPR